MLPTMAFDRAAQLLERRYAPVLDQIVTAVVEAVPRYELLSGVELRDGLGGLVEALLHLLKGGDRAVVRDRLLKNAERRVAQGFSAADYLRAVFVVPTTLQRALRTEAGADAELLAQIEGLSPVLLELTAMAGNFFVDQVARALQHKNIELNRLNQQLLSQHKALKIETADAGRALSASNELNRRVIESLSSGLIVTERTTHMITLYSGRMEEITGISTEEALGRPIEQVFANVGGIDHAGNIAQIHATGSMPLTKLHITLPSGRRKSVYVRGQSLLDEDGVAIGTVLVVDDVTERELLLDSFTRYVSRDLVKRLLARAEPLGLEGERRLCTILFADVRGFTSLAEGQSPEDLHQLLNIYFRLMVDSILKFGGFIDKFVGDKVMALFTDGNAPKDHASAALNAARHIKASLKTLNEERRAQGLQAVDVGIGVNSGEVMLGNIGSDRRMEFTAIGDPVNLADRLQALARNGEVYVGETTAGFVGGDFPLVDRGSQEIRGRAASAHIFELPGS
ncbi:MAG: adenylate/guanylate cyclase domain-containing protein [Deltaproteobacteria bacterium]|nr:adenylate/guanylate cyclase domain-containing protein [Deltaproteobacteria bacterium]